MALSCGFGVDLGGEKCITCIRSSPGIGDNGEKKRVYSSRQWSYRVVFTCCETW